MSSTRKMVTNLKNNTTRLNKVKPSKSLLICSMPCEIQAATIRNRTVDSMNEEDISGVAYRYLQSRRDERNTLYEAAFWGVVSILFVTFIFNTINQIKEKLTSNNANKLEDIYRVINLTLAFFTLQLLAVIANVPPNISNTLRYKEIKNACEEWLGQKIHNHCFNEIKKLPNTRDSLFKLNTLLKQEKTDTGTTTLERQARIP